jgi:hypothetical protein
MNQSVPLIKNVKFRFPERIYYNGKAATKKTLHVNKGTPLPYSVSLGNGAFVFEIQMDLSVWFNGKRYGTDIPLLLYRCSCYFLTHLSFQL